MIERATEKVSFEVWSVPRSRRRVWE